MSSSSSSTPSTTTSDAPSETPTDSNIGGGSSPPSSTLYLLTFLATLFVLLFICSAIILRSFLQRRRLRRQIEAQIAAGLLPPEAALQRLRRHYQYDYGEKPKLWDCYITPAPDPEHARKRWDELEPVAARLSSKDEENKPTFDQPQIHIVEHEPVLYNPFPALFARLRSRIWPRKTIEPSPNDTASDASHDDELPPYDDHTPVQVAVLVQMPTPPRPNRSDNDEDFIPEVSIGVAQLPLRAEHKPAAS